MSEPLIEIVTLDAPGRRTIGPRDRLTERLQDRRQDIESAIRQAASIAAASADATPGPFSLKTIEIAFGITLTAEAGVIVSKAAAEASLEVTLTIERLSDE